MAERTMFVDADTYAVLNDKERKVYFERYTLGKDGVVPRGCPVPKAFAIPVGYQVVEPPKRWPAPTSKWVV